MRLLLALLAASLLAAPADRYASVAVNADGSVTITTENGRNITPSVDATIRNVGAEQAAVAPDHQSVAWLALSYVSPTSHPIPLKLVILRDGRLSSISASEPPIGFWSFQDDGRRVALLETPPRRAAAALYYELWDAESGTRVADYRPVYENGITIERNSPVWVKALHAAEAKSR
jgi:hypothetical protein